MAKEAEAERLRLEQVAIGRLDVVLHQSSTSSLVVRDNSSRRCKQHTKTRSDSLAFAFSHSHIFWMASPS